MQSFKGETMSNQISSKHISYEVNACYIIFCIGS